MSEDWPRPRAPTRDAPARSVAAAAWPARHGWPTGARPARNSAGPEPISAPIAAAALPRGVVIALLVASLAVALVPLAVVRIPPLNDYPFHIARIAILSHAAESPMLQRFYEIRSFLLPNIAMDLVLLAGTKLLSVMLAGRAFVALTLLLMLSGTVALHRSLHHRWSLWPAIAALFLHNWILIFGFLNYLFGLGVMLWGLAIWIAMAERPAWARALVGGLVALAVFFAHMAAFGLYALALAGYELQRQVPRLRHAPRQAVAALAVGALPFAPPLLLFALISPTGQGPIGIRYLPDWSLKVQVIARTFLSMNPWLDGISAIALTGALLVILLRGRIQFRRPMLLAGAVLTVTFLIIPWRMFGAVFVDARLPVALLFVAIACLDVRFRSVGAARLTVAVLAGLLVVRSGVLAADWLAFDRVYDTVTAQLDQIPPGSVIVTATAAPEVPRSLPEWYARWRPPLTHAASLAVLDKPVFAANTWATPSQQPIAVRAPWLALYRLQEQTPVPAASGAALGRFADEVLALTRQADPGAAIYLLLLDPAQLAGAIPAALERVGAGERFTLFRITAGR